MVMMLEMLSDEVLAECAKQRTQEALAVLLGRYADTVYDVVQTLSGGSREADQLTYETLTSAVSWSQELDGNFRIWLFRTAVQNSIGAARRRRPTLFDLSHLAGRLRQALHGIDEVARAAFVLCDLAELPPEEAAAVLQTSTREVRQSVHRARLALIDVSNDSPTKP